MERLRYCLTALEPESRALLELSVRRGVPDADIARLLDVDVKEVGRRRSLAIEGLADGLGLVTRAEIDELRARLPDMPEELWKPAPVVGNGAGPGDLRAASVPPSVLEPARPEEREGQRALTWALVAVLALAAGGALVALASGGGGEHRSASSAPAPAKPERAKGRLRPLPGARGAGAATLDGGLLRLSARGLPAPGGGFYEAWLYNSVGDARPIGRLKGGALDTKLPDGADRYALVDVSREPRDGNPNHSGVSVVRVSLRGLLGRR